MKKKTMMIALCALILVCVGAYAATKITVTDKPQMENVDAVKTDEQTEAVEMAQTAEQAETAEAEIVELGGRITEIADGCIVIETLMHGMVQVNLGDDTLYDGADPDELAVGQYIQVMYDGKMTRSLPAQITAMSLGCNKLSGVVEELSEEGFMLRVEIALEGEEGAEPQVFTESYFVLADGAMMEGLLVDMPVTVFHDGKMTRSIPAQVTAQHVRLMEIEGVIDETTEEGFMMTDVNGMQYRVALMEGAQLFVTPAAGTAVRVAYNGVATMSIPALINAMEVLPVPAVEADLATATMID